jgi:hypothetical protein
MDEVFGRSKIGELVPGRCRITGPARPSGEVAAGVQSVRLLGAENPLADGCQVSELIPGRCQITRQARPSGEVAMCG